MRERVIEKIASENYFVHKEDHERVLYEIDALRELLKQYMSVSRRLAEALDSLDANDLFVDTLNDYQVLSRKYFK